MLLKLTLLTQFFSPCNFYKFLKSDGEKFEVQIYMKASTKTKAEFSKIFFLYLTFFQETSFEFPLLNLVGI